MSKRYRETIEDVEVAVAGEGPPERSGLTASATPPHAFRWRGRRYTVTQVLGHWREDEGWWRGADGEPLRIEQTDLWRVSARNGEPAAGVYEIARRGDEWRLDRVWD